MLGGGETLSGSDPGGSLIADLKMDSYSGRPCTARENTPVAISTPELEDQTDNYSIQCRMQ